MTGQAGGSVKGWASLQAVFAILAAALLVSFLLPLLAFLPEVDRVELARQVERAGLVRAVAVSGASATVATLLAALGGIPLGYLLARERIPLSWLVRTLVLIPLVLPPVAAGVLLLNVYGPGGLVGSLLEQAGWTLVNAVGGIIVAQVFITAPFVILTAEAAFRAVNPRLEAVGATLGRDPGEVFRRISLPLARYGLLAGLALAWMRAAGEFGATVVLAYHPRSLPVQLWVELTGRGLRAALPVALVALALAAVILMVAQRLAARSRGAPSEVRLRGPGRREPDAPRLTIPTPSERPAGDGSLIEARFSVRLGEFVLDADLEAGQEILALFGPSGAGKSTLLRVIAGLLEPDSGRLVLAGDVVCGAGRRVRPEGRPVGLVFQEPSLFPHLSVRENVMFAGNGEGAETFFRQLLGVTRLEGLENRYPAELSGGQQQRVALARALMRRPRILLLDEPFSSLDTNMRERLHRDVRRIQAAFRLCVVYVTHELRDACALGDRMAVIGDGRIEQIGDPLSVIRHPATFDVARFVGVRNLLEGRVSRVAADRISVEVGGLALESRHGGGLRVADRVYVCVRPEEFSVGRSAPEAPEAGPNHIPIVIRDRQLRGATYTLEGEGSGPGDRIRLEIELPVRDLEAMDLEIGEEVVARVRPEAIHLIPIEAADGRRPAERVTAAPPGSS
ncbi:MAG: ATP-binding cassette domain-containing protein [Gemmatimonadota bacterium]|nr:MAG: ATP-binding cassette domain-containing protein [Gemmatimonadota bacterium]